MFNKTDVYLQEMLAARPCFYRKDAKGDRKPAIYLRFTDEYGTKVHISTGAYMPRTENEWADVWNKGFTPSEEEIDDLVFADDEEAEALAETILYARDWSACRREVRRLCELAGLSDEYKAADGDTFENVVTRAAEFFGVTISATTAEMLKSLRKRAGFTQKRFGEVCGGIPERTIQHWENGDRECPGYILYLIRSHLKSQNLI